MGGPLALRGCAWSGSVVADADTQVGSAIHVRMGFDGWRYDGKARVMRLWLSGVQWYADLESIEPWTVSKEG